MNSLKPLLMVAVLGGIGYGVYCRLNSAPPAPPAGISDGWDSPPDVQFDQGADASVDLPGVRVDASSSGWDSDRRRGHEHSSATRDAGFDRGDDTPRGARSTRGDAVAPEKHENWTDQLDSGVPKFDERPGDWARDSASPPIGADSSPALNTDASPFAAAMASIMRDLDAMHLREAHQQLSQWYYHPDLTAHERQQLTDLLDQVAGTVVYSTQHWLEPAYVVRPGDRIEDIAQKYNVPWTILANINGIANPKSLEPGESLKVVRGPFNAIVSLDKGELTLWLADAYAGRFPCGFGREYPAQEGDYRVTEKNLRPVYRGSNRVIGGDDPANPFGGFWISLENQIGIHGTNESQYAGRHDLPGSITLGGRDIADVYDMLSVGSKVTVRR